MIQEIKAYYKDSYLKYGIEWHMEDITKIGYPLFYSYRNVNIAGKILVYPFLFLAFCFYVFVHLLIFSIGLAICIICLICIGIGKLFDLAFLKKEKPEQKQEIKGHRPPTN
jgi:hypothetical protein